MLENQNMMKSDFFIDLLPVGLLYVKTDKTIVGVNRFAAEKLKRSKDELLDQKLNVLVPFLSSDVFEFNPFKEKIESTFQLGHEVFFIQRLPLLENDVQTGAILIFYELSVLEQLAKKVGPYKELSMDLKAIFDISYDVIFVADHTGLTLRVSSACKQLWGYEQEYLVGKSVYQLEKEGVFSPSVTRLVLERKEKVTSIQTTKTGKRLMVIGIPIKDENGDIIRVVNASRDITEVQKLQSELEQLKQVTEGYKNELMTLREKTKEEKQVVYRSTVMKNILALSRRIAEVDSTVLIQGDSGVGKEVIATYIHRSSKRKDKPYITLNCGAIPNDLIEYELFGYEKGGLFGTTEESKAGIVEIANEGTLFLDEIGELPLKVQSKLLRVLSEKEVLRIGASKATKVNVRIIAATKRDLQKEMIEGRFREDLYYRLHVVPITLPPLKERKDDILPLTLHFIKQINKKYQMNKNFSTDVLEALTHYHWPGNVRELENMVERLLVTVTKSIITLDDLPDYLKNYNQENTLIQVSKIIPLKEAMELVEKQLLDMAKEKYQSTTQMAKVLGVNQSTISRKLNKT